MSQADAVLPSIAEMPPLFFWTSPEGVGATRAEWRRLEAGQASEATMIEMQKRTFAAAGRLYEAQVPGHQWWMPPRRAVN